MEIIIENQSKLTPISARTLLEIYDWNSEIIEHKVEELDYLVFKNFGVRDNLHIDLNTQFQAVIEILDEYHEFLGIFSELDDMIYVITRLRDTLYFNNFKSLEVKSQKYLNELIKATMIDLIDFKEKVFIDKDVQNIYYLNASVASTYIEVESLFKL